MRTYPKYERNAHESQSSRWASGFEACMASFVAGELSGLSLGGFGLDQTPRRL